MWVSYNVEDVEKEYLGGVKEGLSCNWWEAQRRLNLTITVS